MGQEINLLSAIPKARRNVQARKDGKDPEVVRISKQYGEMYFDGPRDYGYGGYRYDGRWQPVARDLVAHFGLQPGDKVLDVGCAKGFLVKDLMTACPGLEAFGADVSRYALMHCEPEVVGRLQLASAVELPFPDASFDAVVSINTIHNLDHDGCVKALQEFTRICRTPENCFIQVDAYRTAQEKELFESWCLTAITYLTPAEWIALFDEAGYKGDFYWTILEAGS
jgi:cyclopropane fatty-acyl-phospholipid synthase-like methyltransferase